MKYLKFFEALPKILIPKEEIEKFCTPLVNWDLIYDIKDISLDFLDNGYELYLSVDYYYKYYLSSLFCIQFNHQINITKWHDLTNIIKSEDFTLDYYKNVNFSYRFALTKKWNYSKNKGGYYTKESNQILDIIKEMYPNEEIDIYTTDNFFYPYYPNF